MPLANAILEDVELIFRNFAGKEDQYNREGSRNFSVVLNPQLAEAMARDGWNIKTRPPREEGDDEVYYLPVAVSYKNRPPKIVMITSRGQNHIHEDLVETLDFVDIKHVDLIVNPYEWSAQGKGGIKAYLQSMYITIEEDPLELKYNKMAEDAKRDQS